LKKIKISKKLMIVIISIIILLGIILVLLFSDKDLKSNLTDEPSIDELYSGEGTINFDNLTESKIIDGNKVNVSSKLKKDHEIVNGMTGKVLDDIIVRDAELRSDGDVMVVFKAIIKNNRSTPFLPCTLRFRFYNDKKELIYEYHYFLGRNVLSGVSYEIEFTDSADFTNAYDYEVEIDGDIGY